jgi:hypothetical protein
MSNGEGDPLSTFPGQIGNLAIMQDRVTHVLEENQLLTNVVSPRDSTEML